MSEVTIIKCVMASIIAQWESVLVLGSHKNANAKACSKETLWLLNEKAPNPNTLFLVFFYRMEIHGVFAEILTKQVSKK